MNAYVREICPSESRVVMSSPDQLLESELHSVALRLARERGDVSQAVEELQSIAGGRSDLLAEAAGVMSGYWSTKFVTCLGHEPVAAGLLIMAGADRDQLTAWYDEGRRRGLTPMHSTP